MAAAGAAALSAGNDCFGVAPSDFAKSNGEQLFVSKFADVISACNCPPLVPFYLALADAFNTSQRQRQQRTELQDPWLQQFYTKVRNILLPGSHLHGRYERHVTSGMSIVFQQAFGQLSVCII